jgi:hypothetical protein
MLKIEGAAFLVQIEGLKILAVMLTERERPHAAAGIPAHVPVFDLDDFRPEICEIHRTERTGAEILQRQYADTA